PPPIDRTRCSNRCSNAGDRQRMTTDSRSCDGHGFTCGDPVLNAPDKEEVTGPGPLGLTQLRSQVPCPKAPSRGAVMSYTVTLFPIDLGGFIGIGPALGG